MVPSVAACFHRKAGSTVDFKAVRLMDELGTLSPASRERSLDELPRKELQQLAKEAGVKVDSDSCHLL